MRSASEAGEVQRPRQKAKISASAPQNARRIMSLLFIVVVNFNREVAFLELHILAVGEVLAGHR